MRRQESRLRERIDSNNAAQMGVVEARSAAKPERACFSAHMIIPLPVTQKSMPVAIIKGISLRDGQMWELRKQAIVRIITLAINIRLAPAV